MSQARILEMKKKDIVTYKLLNPPLNINSGSSSINTPNKLYKSTKTDKIKLGRKTLIMLRSNFKMFCILPLPLSDYLE